MKTQSAQPPALKAAAEEADNVMAEETTGWPEKL